MRGTLEVLRPPPRRTVTEWSDSFRKLSRESSAEPGQWRTDRVPYVKEIMDSMNDPEIEEIVFKKSSQIAATETILNLIGYHIDQDPAPMLLVLPTKEIAEAFSKDRLAPMIRDTPRIKGKIKDNTSRDAGNTLLHKKFPGGHITIGGANSPASLASRPIRLVLFDEVSRFPASAGNEGDPVSLAQKRATTFWNRKYVLVSTPTVKGACRISRAYERSDKRVYEVPCHKCEAMQVLRWEHVKWDDSNPKTARYECEVCKAPWTDAERWDAVQKGKWKKTAKGNGRTAGFWIWSAYNPWTELSELVEEFLTVKNDPEELQVFVNTRLAEEWEEKGERQSSEGIESRAEFYEVEPLKKEVVILTCGVDTQDDRLELEILGWGKDQENWSVDYRVLLGDPASPGVWQELDAVLKEQFLHADGYRLPIASTCIDSGGHHTQAVYDFCAPRYARRIFAIKGMQGEGKPIWPRKAAVNVKSRHKVNLFLIGVDAAKERLFKRLEIEEGPGCCHFPTRYGPEYFVGLTNEEKKRKYKLGRPVFYWKKLGRNEPLDCRVYAMAGLESLAIDLNRLADSRAKRGVSSKKRRKRGMRSKGIR